jgi:hypothetical protein
VEEPLKLSPPLTCAGPSRNAAAPEQIPPYIVFATGKIFGVAMREIDFAVPRNADLGRVERLIEKICARRGLLLAMKGSLSSYPGCVHWHYKRQSHKGTLELTLFARDRRVWAKVQDGRRAPWIDEELPGLQRDVERALKSGAPRMLRDCQFLFPVF